MRTRIVIAVVAILLSLTAYADAAVDRDMLLAGDGTLYSAESVLSATLPTLSTPSSRVLTLTVQSGADKKIVPVPASLNGGANIHPALAYDNDSNTIFIFWEVAGNSGLSTDLLLCSYKDGRWGKSAVLDPTGLTLRSNLRIAITKRVEQPAEDGGTTLGTEINVHAIWWEDSGAKIGARYAMLTIGDGEVKSVYVGDASEFLSAQPTKKTATATNDLLRHPAVLENPAHDTVDLVFGDIATGTMHRATVKPIAIAQGRLRIPIGVKDTELPIVKATVNATSSAVSAMSTSPDNLAYYFSSDDSLRYVVLKEGKWTAQSIALSETVSRDAAIDALRRMLSSQ